MFYIGLHGVMTFHPDIIDGIAIADYDACESPFIAQDLTQKALIAATRFAVDAVVGAHDLAYICFLNEVLEGRHISLPEIAQRQLVDADAVAAPFGAAVNGEVLGTGKGLVVARGGWPRCRSRRGKRLALQAVHHSLP